MTGSMKSYTNLIIPDRSSLVPFMSNLSKQVRSIMVKVARYLARLAR
jgi:hypothetical protein